MATIWFEVSRGENKGKRTVERFVVERQGDEAPYGLQRLVGLMDCMGIKAPKGTKTFDLDNFLGKEVSAEIIPDDDYNGRPQSQIGSYIPPKKALDDDEDDDEEEDEEEEEDEDDEEEEAPPRKSAKKAPAKRRRKDEDEDEDDDDDSDDEDDDDEDFPF